MRTHPRTPSAATIVVLVALVIGACSEKTSTSDAPAIAPTIGVVDTSTGGTEPSPGSSTPLDVSTTPDEASPDDESSPTASPAMARLDAVPTDAAGFAAALSSAHLTMTDPSAPPDAIAIAGEQMQLHLRALADAAALDEQVLEALTPLARPTIERVVRARQFLQARNAARETPSEPPNELPAWTIVEPEPIDVLLAHYAEAESLTGIPWYWLAAIHLQETRMGRIQGVSSAGAVGPMQFLPTTWAGCCTGDPLVTRDAIIGAATYLAQSGGPADMNAAVFQYNPNDGYVAVVTAYAENLRDTPALYAGYHAFQVFFGTSAGTVRLPVGYSQTGPVDAATYLAAHPLDAA